VEPTQRLEQSAEKPQVLLEPDATSDLDEVLAPDAAVLGIVQQQVGQLPALNGVPRQPDIEGRRPQRGGNR